MKLTDMAAQLEAALIKPAPVPETVIAAPIVDDAALLVTKASLLAKEQELQQLQEINIQHLAKHADLLRSLLTATSDHTDLKQHYSKLTDSNGSLNASTQALTERCEQQALELTKRTVQISSLQAEISALQASVNSLQATVSSLSASSANLNQVVF